MASAECTPKTECTPKMLLEQMRSEGYQPGLPGRIKEYGAEIDGAVCAEGFCAECGHKGLSYAPFRKSGSYRAFATCPECGNWEEF